MPTPPRSPLIRFGVYELDPANGDLRRQGIRVKLSEKAFQLLLALLERPGDVITRQALQNRLWPDDTFVEFDNNLNNAVSRLRDALRDSSESPRFIETLPRRGYRFIAPVVGHETVKASEPGSAPPGPSAASSDRAASTHRRSFLTALPILLLAGVAATVFLDRPTTTMGIRSIAVLPLAHASVNGAPDDEYLADGMTGALITELAKLGVTNVISETSVMPYRNTRKSIPVIARELSVDAVIEGDVAREGDIVRVNVQLIRGATDRHLWAESYEREVRSILSLQNDIAREIARAIDSRLRPPGARLLPIVNPKAHEAYLRGRYFLRFENEDRLKQSVPFLEEALRIDPTYAPAYAGLAHYYAYTDAVSPEVAMPKARSYARKALELDETLSDAHFSLGLVSLWGDWDWEETEREFKRALQLDAGNGMARRWYAVFLALMGRFDGALGETERAVRMNPLSLSDHHTRGWVLSLTGRLDEAIQEVERMKELDPNNLQVPEDFATYYTMEGRYEAAVRECERGMAVWGRDPNLVGALAIVHARAGNTEKAEALLRELEAMKSQRYIPTSWFGIIQMHLGRIDQAMRSLQQAYRERDSYMPHLKVNWLFNPARSDPRFQALLRRMNFP